MVPLILPLVVAVVAGDAIAGRPGSGRCATCSPRLAGRTRLLGVKFAGMAVFALATSLVVVVAALVTGLLLFPVGPVTLLSGTTVPLLDGLLRIGLIALYVTLGMIALGTLALAVSAFTDTPIGAIVTAIVVVLVSQVLALVPQLDVISPYLLPTWFQRFDGALREPLATGDMGQGCLAFAAYIAIFGSIAWARFTLQGRHRLGGGPAAQGRDRDAHAGDADDDADAADEAGGAVGAAGGVGVVGGDGEAATAGPRRRRGGRGGGGGADGVVVVTGGRGQLQGRDGVFGLAAVGLRLVLPLDDLAAAVGLLRREVEVVGRGGQAAEETSNSWNSPGFTSPPDQVILVTASVISPYWDWTGVGSLPSVTSAFQPGTGLTETNGSGASTGKVTSILVVEASSRSLGTRKATLLKLPCGTEPGWTVTWASAGTAKPSVRAVAVAVMVRARRMMDMTKTPLVSQMGKGDGSRARPVEDLVG